VGSGVTTLIFTFHFSLFTFIYKKPPRDSSRGSSEKYLKYEMTLDRSDFFPFASSAVKGHFIEFLISNIVVTSLSAYFGALPRQRDHFLQLTAFDRFTIFPNVG
jgi:hypothetical protein